MMMMMMMMMIIIIVVIMFIIRRAREPRHAGLACSALRSFVGCHREATLPLAGQICAAVAEMPVESSVAQQTLCETVGLLCARGRGAPQAFLEPLLRQLLAAEGPAALGACVENLACFLGGLGAADGAEEEWGRLLGAVRLAVGRTPPDRQVGAALASLGRKAALPGRLLLPFLADVWGSVVEDGLHLQLLAHLLGAFREEAAGFAPAALAASARAAAAAAEPDGVEPEVLAAFLECAALAAELGRPGVAWDEPAVQGLLLGALAAEAEGSRHLLLAARAWRCCLAAGAAPPAGLAEGLQACAERSQLDGAQGGEAVGEVLACLGLLHQRQGLPAAEVLRRA